MFRSWLYVHQRSRYVRYSHLSVVRSGLSQFNAVLAKMRSSWAGRSDTFDCVSEVAGTPLIVTVEADPLLRTYSEGMQAASGQDS